VTQVSTASHTVMLVITKGGGDQSNLEGYVKNSKFVIVGSALSVFEILHNFVDCVRLLNWLNFWQTSSISLLSGKKM
jgi:hypothetical protein